LGTPIKFRDSPSPPSSPQQKQQQQQLQLQLLQQKQQHQHQQQKQLQLQKQQQQQQQQLLPSAHTTVVVGGSPPANQAYHQFQHQHSGQAFAAWG
jgi:predicted lysophospholipase L1 biosynthesis ABC-type transport system permease subunit